MQTNSTENDQIEQRPPRKRRRNPLPAELRPEDVVAIIDTREQLPFDLAPLKTVRGALQTGDYSFVGGEAIFAWERKSIPDLVSWITTERERAERNKERLLAYASRGLVIEGSWADIEAGNWRSKASPRSIAQSLLSWVAQGIPILLPGGREQAADVMARLIYLSARRTYRVARSMVEGLAGEQEADA